MSAYFRKPFLTNAFLLLTWGTFSPAITADEPANFATGNDFSRLLNRPLLINRDYSPLREVLQSLSEDRHIAVCLDRRIDPGRLVLVDLQAPFFDSGLAQLAEPIPAGAVVVAEAVFVTTPETATTLRTRIALAQAALEQLPKSNFSRQLDLSHKATLHWDQLTSPRETLVNWAGRYHVDIENAQAIPHDLWNSGSVPHADFLSGALLIAVQYDLELKWINDQRVLLVPLTPDPVLEQEHVFRGRTRKDVQAFIKEHFPQRKADYRPDRVRLGGSLEDQEELDTWLGLRAPRKASTSVMATSLANRRFTLRMNNRPFSELLDVLEKQGIHFDRHPRLLDEAGINLDQVITLELEEATIDQLLSNACSPLGLSYSIDGTQIDLTPAPATPEKSGR